MYKPPDKIWSIVRKWADYGAISHQYGISRIKARLLRNRDIIGDEQIDEYLNGSMDDLFPPEQLKGMDLAVDILVRKIHDQLSIRIIGDYDADGIMSSFILHKGILKAGGKADVRIPHRIHDGYGVNKRLIEEAEKDGIDTILTCDNGSKAIEQFQEAKSKGMTVIITDHHEFSFDEKEGNEKEVIIPPCDVLIDPKQPGCSYPNKDICGAGLAFKLITALYRRLQIPSWELEEFIEMAAIATVTDVVKLQGENHILVKEGMRRIPYTDNLGLRTLLEALDLLGREITSYHLGFRIGPCFNASGRLDSAMLSVELLETGDPETARALAGRLVELNETRKSLTEKGVRQAMAFVEEESDDPACQNSIDRILVVYLKECHESVAGIVAGRLKTTFNRPVFVLTDGKNDVKGSGRSVEAYNMAESLEEAKNRNPSLLHRFGGHPMAAGLSLPEENVDLFRKTMNVYCNLTEEELRPKILVDAILPLRHVTLELCRQIHDMEPFGTGNSRPLFISRNVNVWAKEIFGNERKVAKIDVSDSSMGRFAKLKALRFDDAGKFMEDLGSRNTIYAIVYYPEINVYRGEEYLQIVIEDYRMDPPQ